ncbi:MAG: hypothetical protein ACRCZ5_09895, partial [Burkholderiales bacterium]
KEPGAQKTRHIMKIGEFSSTARRGNSPAQPINQRLPKSRQIQATAPAKHPHTHPITIILIYIFIWANYIENHSQLKPADSPIRLHKLAQARSATP